MAEYILSGLVILHALSGTQGVLDITCFISRPRIDIAGDNNLFISGFKSGDDTGADVTFGRVTDTGTGNGLPSGSHVRNHPSGRERAQQLTMPQTGGVERIGAFYCEAQKGNIQERIPAIIMASNSVVTPQRSSQTVNIGDDVTLSVITDIVNIRWRLNGSGIRAWDEQKGVQISNVQVRHGGIYECNQAGNREEGRHAIFLLVVRACASGKWGLPACANDCPVCFNGGICDERSGHCVCAPGFSGNTCETVHGRNKWGQDGGLTCSRRNIDACRGILFCLPHPYGCSCGAGYRGIDCDQDCKEGTYGAGCRSQCHCNRNVSCSADTGVCSDGQCHSDWYGDNCQNRCPEPQTAIGLQAEMLPTMVISIQWDEVLPCSTAILRYQVNNNLERCRERKDNTTELSSNEYEISNLQTYSKYIINLEIIRNGETEISIREIVNVTTNATEPQIAPVFTADLISTADSLSFSWDAIPCESQGGPGLRYAFNLSANGGIVTDTTYNTTASFSDLGPCTLYTFEVRAVNDIGFGESSVKTVYTAVKKPGPYELLVSQTSSPYELSVSWLELIGSQCIVGEYIIRYTLINQDQCNEDIEETIQMVTSDLMLVLDNLYPYSTYRVSITAVNSAGEGMESSMIQTTYEAEPSLPPSNISDKEVGSTMLSMQWMEPPCGSRHGELSYIYRLKNQADAVVRTGVTQSTSVTMTDLEPLTHYTFQVAAVTDVGGGPWSGPYDTVTTRKEIKDPAKLPDMDDSQVTLTAFATVRIIIPQSTDELVTGYQVGVQIKEVKPKRQTSRFGHYFDTKEAYVTAELSKNDVLQSPVFLVGDGQIYGQYYNAPLEANQMYTLHVAFVVRINNTVFEAYWSEGTDVTTPFDRSKISIAAITAIIAVLVIVIIISAIIIGILSLLLLRAKKQHRENTKSTPLGELATTTDSPSKQIKMSPEGYAEYKPNGSESASYQDLGGVDRPLGQEEDAYEEIPASAEYDNTFLSTDDEKQEEDGAYTNDSIIKRRPPNNLQPQE